MTVQAAARRGVFAPDAEADKAARDALTAVALLLDEAAAADRDNPEIERMYRFAASAVRHRVDGVVRYRDQIIANGGWGQ